MSAKLPIGSGLARARKNRSRGPRVKTAGQLLRQRRIDWDSVSGFQLADNPALARRFARETKGCK